MISRILVKIQVCVVAYMVIIMCWPTNSAASAPVSPSPQIRKPTNEALAHGRLQTERMLHDLPAMRLWLTKDNPFYDFAVQHYAADATGRRIYWIPFEDNAWESRGVNAVSATAKGDYCGSISIRKIDFRTKKPLAAENLWVCLVFECFNTFDSDRCNKIKSDGISGKLNREQFILKCSEYEYISAKETNRFYLTKVVPWAKKNRIRTNGFDWYQNIPPTFEQDMKYFQDKTKYPWSFFGTYYDTFIIKEQKKNRVNLK